MATVATAVRRSRTARALRWRSFPLPGVDSGAATYLEVGGDRKRRLFRSAELAAPAPQRPFRMLIEPLGCELLTLHDAGDLAYVLQRRPLLAADLGRRREAHDQYQ